MPNWAYTTYKIKGSEVEVAALHNTIKDLDQRKESLLSNGFGKLWLGNLVNALGGDWEKVYCRGQITDYNLENGILTINTETAWGEMSDTRHFIKSKYPSLEIYFQTEEPGMCIFLTNDSAGTYFPDRWLLDWNDEKDAVYVYEYFKDLPAVVNYLKENSIITTDIEPTREAIIDALDQIQEERPDDISYFMEEFKVVED